MDSFLHLMNGFFLQKNLMECGKGVSLAGWKELRFLQGTQMWFIFLFLQLNIRIWSQAEIVAICCKCFAFHWKESKFLPCILESVRNLFTEFSNILWCQAVPANLVSDCGILLCLVFFAWWFPITSSCWSLVPFSVL